MTGRQSFGRVVSARAQADPQGIVVVSDHEGLSLTAAELDARSNALAREYLSRGVTRDDLVTVALPNSIEFVVACVAVWKAGATPNPLSPSMSDRAHIDRLVRPALALGTEPGDPAVAWLPAGFATERADHPLPDAWAGSWKAPASSGSTGQPKVVLADAPALMDPAQPVAAFLPRRATQLVTAPLWHSAQFTYAFRGLLTGHRLVLTEGFDEQRFCALVQRYSITWTMLSPNAIHRLVRGPRDGDISSLETVLHLGAPCAPSDKQALIDWLGAHRVVEVYAGSESNGLTMITGTESLHRPGSVGKPIGGTEIQILDDDGRPCATGDIGHIWMRRGTSPAYRYLGAASRRTSDGWDTLGDLGFLDGDGYLTIVDRASDVIRNDGVAVYPSRVEHALIRHPAVRDAVVVAHPDHGVAAVVEVDDRVDVAVLVEFVRPTLTAAEVPSHIEIRRSPLRNPAGKVRRSTFRTETIAS